MANESIHQYKNNCVLVAIKEVSNLDDATILMAVRRHGYRNDRGMHQRNYMLAMSELGVRLGQLVSPPIEYELCGSDDGWSRRSRRPRGSSLAELLGSALSRGVHLVRTRGHLLVVRDGRLVDRNFRHRPSLKRLVVDYVEVLNPHRPEVRGHVRVVRQYRKQTGRLARFKAMADFVGLHPNGVTRDQVLASTPYTVTDFAWDLRRGNIEIV